MAEKYSDTSSDMDVDSDSERGIDNDTDEKAIEHPVWLDPLFEKVAKVKAQDEKRLPKASVQDLANFVQNAPRSVRSQMYVCKPRQWC